MHRNVHQHSEVLRYDQNSATLLKFCLPTLIVSDLPCHFQKYSLVSNFTKF